MIGAQPFVPLHGDPFMEAVDVRGRFVWHQLMTRDVPGAKKFYSKLVGWKTMPWPLDPAYTVCHADAGPVAGIMEITADLPADMPSHWVQYIGTRDVDGTAEAAVRAGGSVMKAPSDMQGAGRYAIIKDPQGAAFAIIDPENARPEAGHAPAGTLLLARARHHRPRSRICVLQRAVRMGCDAAHGHGSDRDLPDLRPERRATRRHVHSAVQYADAAELDAVRTGAQRGQGPWPGDVDWRPHAGCADGCAGRQPHRLFS